NYGDLRFGDVADVVGFDGDTIRHGQYPARIKEKHGREDEKPFRANGNTFDVACADYDNDGDIDLFVAEIAHAWAGESSDRSCLLVNLGAGSGYRFERRHDLGIDRFHDGDRWNEGDLYAAWIDFDNDGLQDLLISSGAYPDGQFLRLFQQQPDHRFVEVTDKAGFAWEGSGCLSLADFDRDGDVDILVTRSNHRLPAARRSALPPRVALFRNDVGNRNHFLTVRLIGRGNGGSNRSAIGARVVVRAGKVVQTREVYGGLGHNTHRNEFPLTFGLGEHDRVDSIEVHWPNRDRTITRLRDVEADRMIDVFEGATGSVRHGGPRGRMSKPSHRSVPPSRRRSMNFRKDRCKPLEPRCTNADFLPANRAAQRLPCDSVGRAGVTPERRPTAGRPGHPRQGVRGM
ncbi:MAG: CRTAC1 family protein, partial [Phycisphaerae bacterium]